MASKLWPFGRSNDNIEKNNTLDIGGTFALGVDLPVQPVDDASDTPNTAYVMDNLATHTIVSAAIRQISTSVSSIPLKVVQLDEYGETTEVAGSLADILRNPNPEQDGVLFIETMVSQLLIAGNVFMLMQKNKSGRITELHLLPPDRISLKIAGKGEAGIGGVKAYTYEVSTSQKIDIDASEIGWLKLPNNTTHNRLWGRSPLLGIQQDIITDNLLSQLLQSFLKRGGIPSGLLSVKRRVDAAGADELRSRWRSQFGSGSAFNLAVMDSDASYSTIQNPVPSEISMTDSRDELIARLTSAIGVNPLLLSTTLGLKNSSYSNMAQASQNYLTETVEPMANRLVNWLNKVLAPNYAGYPDTFIQYDTTKSPAWNYQMSDQAKRVRLLFDSGMISLNEARSQLGFSSLGASGQIRRSPANSYEMRINEERQLPIVDDAKMYKGLTPPVDILPPPISGYPDGFKPIERSQELINSIRKNEQQHIDKIAKDINRIYFRPLINRADGIIGRIASSQTGAAEFTKQDLHVEDFAPPEMAQELALFLEGASLAIMRETFEHIRDTGILPRVEWQADATYIKRGVFTAGRNAQFIHDTTSKIYRELIDFISVNNLSIEDLRNGGTFDSHTYRGMRQILQDMSTNRLPLIARTEVSNMQLNSSLSYYQQYGAQRVYISDGDIDAPCANRNGTTISITPGMDDQGSEISLAHPNCQVVIIPLAENINYADITPVALNAADPVYIKS